MPTAGHSTAMASAAPGRCWSGSAGTWRCRVARIRLPYLHTMWQLREHRRAAAGAGVGQCADPGARSSSPAALRAAPCRCCGAHAEFLKLLIAREHRRPIELLQAVEQRYASRPISTPRAAPPGTGATKCRCCGMKSGRALLIEDRVPFTLHFGFDGWQRVEDARPRRSRSACGRCACRPRSWRAFGGAQFYPPLRGAAGRASIIASRSVTLTSERALRPHWLTRARRRSSAAWRSRSPYNRLHPRLYLAEGAGTALLVLFGLSMVIAFFAEQRAAALLPSAARRRVLAGGCFGTVGALITISPLGPHQRRAHQSGGELAFWLERKLAWRDALGYVLAQMLGAARWARRRCCCGGRRAQRSVMARPPSDREFPVWTRARRRSAGDRRAGAGDIHHRRACAHAPPSRPGRCRRCLRGWCGGKGRGRARAPIRRAASVPRC